MRTALTVALLTLATSPVAAAPQVKADVTCLVEKALNYACLVRLTRADTNAAIDGADVTVVADLPAAPLGSRARPVPANAIGQPGIYQFRLSLDRLGEWSLRIGLTRPVRDIVETRLDFGDSKVTPKAQR